MGARIKKPTRRFEPITQQQNRKLHAIIKQNILTEKRLYEMVGELIGISSISALSKQEASFIIRRAEGRGGWSYARIPRITNPPSMDSSNLPNLSYIRAIRSIAMELGWDKEHLKNWLKKYMKTRSIRNLDSESARKAFIGMRKIQTNIKSKS